MEEKIAMNENVLKMFAEVGVGLDITQGQGLEHLKSTSKLVCLSRVDEILWAKAMNERANTCAFTEVDDDSDFVVETPLRNPEVLKLSAFMQEKIMLVKGQLEHRGNCCKALLGGAAGELLLAQGVTKFQTPTGKGSEITEEMQSPASAGLKKSAGVKFDHLKLRSERVKNHDRSAIEIRNEMFCLGPKNVFPGFAIAAETPKRTTVVGQEYGSDKLRTRRRVEDSLESQIKEIDKTSWMGPNKKTNEVLNSNDKLEIINNIDI